MQTVRIDLPGTLLERAGVPAPDEARTLITSLLEDYVLALEKTERGKAYEAYYVARTQEEEAEELEVHSDFMYADAEISDDSTS